MYTLVGSRWWRAVNRVAFHCAEALRTTPLALGEFAAPAMVYQLSQATTTQSAATTPIHAPPV